MHDPLTVGSRQRVSHLHDDLERLGRGQPLPLEPGRQRLPLDVLHDDEASVTVGADLVDGADVGMIERGGGARLAQERLAGLVVVQSPRGEQLDRDRAIQVEVVGQIDLAHAADAQTTPDPIVGNNFFRLHRVVRERPTEPTADTNWGPDSALLVPNA